jgi:glycosyltransferase involved in cell wall biosynthesis
MASPFMRVGLVIYGSLETVSGGYLYDRRLVDYLKQQGDQVDVISLPWRSYAGHLMDNFSADLRRRLEGDFDVILQDELNHPSLAWLNSRLRHRAPLVSIVHHLRSSEARPDWQNKFYRAVERQYLASLDAFIFNSQTTRRAVEDLIDQETTHVVAYPGGDRFGKTITPEAVARRARTKPLRILFVGNLIPRKGLHTLLAALARLTGVDWRLAIVGSMRVDPKYARYIYGLLNRADMDKRVSWRGSLADAELAKEMEASHVLVVPSTYEGFGIVYLEGMSFGLPAVGTTAGAADEIITNGEDGFLIPPEDVIALVEYLSSLATDRDRLERMGKAALNRFKRHPSWEQTGADIRQFLVSLKV